MLGFGPFCLDLGHIAWIWAIWQNLGQNRPQRRRSPEDGAGGTFGRTDVRTYGRTDSPCVLQDFVPFGAAALLPLNLNQTLLKQGTGTADHLLPLGCYSTLLLLPKCSIDLKYSPRPLTRDWGSLVSGLIMSLSLSHWTTGPPHVLKVK